MENKMKIEIWSDVMCPFCYIGKREFEKALKLFPHKNMVEIEWKSYQLAPDMITVTSKTASESLAQHKGISIEEANQMQSEIAKRAAASGLEFHFEKSITANTMKAHGLIHFAKKYGKQSEAEELLFRAYFTEGKNVDDIPTLLDIGNELGLPTDALNEALVQDVFHEAIQEDIYEAFQLGVRGVPFFVFERKYAVSGAQSPQVFAQTLEKTFSEWKKAQGSLVEVKDGETCKAGGSCN